MNRSSPRPYMLLVVVGVILSCWVSMNEIPAAICRLIFIKKLLVPGTLSPNEQYLHYVELTNWNVENRLYKLADKCAVLAVQNRPGPAAPGIEEPFISTLIGLTRYEEAKQLLLRLAPLNDQSPGYDSASISTRRRALMAQSCMGLHQYRLVTETANEAPENLDKTYIFEIDLAQNAFVANLCINDKQSALRALDRYHACRENERKFYGSCNEARTVVGLFYPIINLSPNEFGKASQICQKHLDFWTAEGFASDPECIPLLEAASQSMANRGYPVESRRLASAAQKLRSNYQSSIL